MKLEEAKEIIKSIDTLDDYELQEAIETVIGELFAMQNLLDEKNEEIEHLQKENEEFKKYSVPKDTIADLLLDETQLYVKYREASKINNLLKNEMWNHLGAINTLKKLLGEENVATEDKFGKDLLKEE